MGRVIPLFRADSERLLSEWIEVAERAVFVADLTDELGDCAEAAQVRADLYSAYVQARANYQYVDGMGVSRGQ